MRGKQLPDERMDGHALVPQQQRTEAEAEDQIESGPRESARC